MSSLQLVHLADVPPEPWRNGGGSTRTLLAWPQRDGWQLRVSVAHIGRDGPFSAFPGIARCFAVLQGPGVQLQLPDGERWLTPQGPALCFDGAAAPGCSLLGGPTDDLNLMALHSAGQPRLWRASAGASWPQGSLWRGLYAVQPASVHCRGQEHALPAGSLLWAAGQDEPPWRVLQAPHAWCLGLER